MNLNPNITPAPKTIFNQKAFYEVWHLKLNDPTHHRALWLRFTRLSSSNGFHRVAEVWGIFFQKTSSGEMKKVALKQSYDLNEFSFDKNNQILLGKNELAPEFTRGSIYSKGNSMEWNLSFDPKNESTFSFIPRALSKTKIIQFSASTVCEDLLLSGTTKVNGETVEWKNCGGMLGYFQGPRAAHSWVRAHCNAFTDDKGEASSFVFEGLSIRAALGPMVTPRFSSFFFFYKGEKYYFNRLKDTLSLKSSHVLNEWNFQADRGELSFRGNVQANHKDFAGLTFEDTNGSLLYCTHSEMAQMRILVYRNGKLEATLNAADTASLEIVSRTKNPYVPMMI